MDARKRWPKVILGFMGAMVLTLSPFALSPSGSQVSSGGPLKEEREVLQTLLPRETEISGLKALSEGDFYIPENLWEYMDGQAEAYLGYDFKLLMVRDYDAGDGSRITLEIYKMASPGHAFGIYAAERSPDDEFIKIGGQGYLGDCVLGFWKGPYYVKILCFRLSPATRALLEKTGGIISDKIPGTYSVPDLFLMFPEEFRVKMSERFIPKNFLGQSFLKNGYRADYERGRETYQVFLLQEGSKKEAQELFQRYHDLLQAKGEKISRFTKEDYEITLVQGDKDKTFFHWGPFWGGVLDHKDFSSAERIIQEMVGRLKARNP